MPLIFFFRRSVEVFLLHLFSKQCTIPLSSSSSVSLSVSLFLSFPLSFIVFLKKAFFVKESCYCREEEATRKQSERGRQQQQHTRTKPTIIMLGKEACEIQTTVEAVVESFTFGPDCTVESVLPGAVPDLVGQVGRAFRLSAINGEPTTDSGELKARLLAAAGKGNGAVTATFERTTEHGLKVEIEDSVTCNGEVSEVVKPNKAAVKELLESAGPPPSAVASETADGAPRLWPTFPGNATSGPTRSPAGGAGSNLNASISESEGSTGDFNTVRLSQLSKKTTMDNSFYASQVDTDASPDLPQFEKMRLSVRTEDVVVPRDFGSSSVKSQLTRALEKVQPGHCVICVTREINPIAEIELLALAAKKRVVSFDLGVKLRLRPKPEVLAAQFAEAMRTGAWFVLVNAHKSINTCTLFDELLADAQAHQLEGFDPSARIIISLESHPHFPERLIRGSVAVKMVSSFQNSSIFSDSMATSLSRNRLVTADALSASLAHPPGDARQALSSSVTTAAQAPPKRRVRINAAVDIVDIAPREIVKDSGNDNPIDVSGSVALIKTFNGVPYDKFLCVRSAGEGGRFAVGSSFGNVYFLDSLGNSLLQAHAHNASIWDVSFLDKYHFATGCEDGTSVAWSLLGGDGVSDSAGEAELKPASATSLGADVYCVSYLHNMNPSPLLIGGLHDNLVVRAANSDEVHLVKIPTNAQVVGCLPSSSIALVGGGDGSVCVVDVEQVTPLTTLREHSRKLPALTVRDDNQFFTGSFDSSILSWDLRTPGGVTGAVGEGDVGEVTAHTMHTLKLKNYVTGLDVDDVHLAASVGENLYLWDVRKLSTVLGGYPQGWKGLSRGIKVDSMGHLVVTASPDGNVRFWTFV